MNIQKMKIVSGKIFVSGRTNLFSLVTRSPFSYPRNGSKRNDLDFINILNSHADLSRNIQTFQRKRGSLSLSLSVLFSGSKSKLFRRESFEFITHINFLSFHDRFMIILWSISIITAIEKLYFPFFSPSNYFYRYFQMSPSKKLHPPFFFFLSFFPSLYRFIYIEEDITAVYESLSRYYKDCGGY